MKKKTKIILLIIFLTCIVIIGVVFLIYIFIIPLLPKVSYNTLVYIIGITLTIITLITRLIKIYEFIEKHFFCDAPQIKKTIRNKRTNWEDYDNLFKIDKYYIPYLPIINNWKNQVVLKIDWNLINISRHKKKFILASIYDNIQISLDYSNDSSCRLSSYNIKNNRKKVKIDIQFQETTYGDYLKSGEHLDDPFPVGPHDTIRDHIGNIKPKELLEFDKLTNICGVGIFILTSDNYLILSKHSKFSHVYPDRFTFSSSGLIKWGAYPHPIMEIARKTFLEIQHQINVNNVKLVNFGVDARKLYFQFCFVEETDYTADEIIRTHSHILDENNKSIIKDRPTDLIKVKFKLEDVIEKIFDSNYCWEPAAESSILTMLVDKFSYKKVSQLLHERKNEWKRKKMEDEWDIRASLKGDLPDMSVRYPVDRLSEEKLKYLDAIFNFMGDDIKEKDILEIGAGTGKVTEKLFVYAKKLTCIDFCKKMIHKNKIRLSERVSKINYINSFAQDYHPSVKHDITICSLVLIHNVENSEFNKLVEVICHSCNIAYIFEDITENRKTSYATKLCTKDKLLKAFKRNGFILDKNKCKEDYLLFQDNIGFYKFWKVDNNSN